VNGENGCKAALNGESATHTIGIVFEARIKSVDSPQFTVNRTIRASTPMNEGRALTTHRYSALSNRPEG
jgi:hypothetical protein